MCGGGRHASFPLSISKEALWQEASSHKGDEGLTRTMEVQMLKPEGSGKSSYVSPCCYVVCFVCFAARQVLLLCSPMPDLVSGTNTCRRSLRDLLGVQTGSG